jgi:hypothetical protein
MEKITTVGLDIAKSVFQVHAVAEDGAVLVRRSLRRTQVLEFSASWRPALSAWRRAAARITGPGRSLRWATVSR